jgi:aryl-alcohol dehydrogenase-like predicted oxidoreductase
MRPGSTFEGDDLRRVDPKFQEPRFAEYLNAVAQLEGLAQSRFQRDVIQLAVRWILDQGVNAALWGARRPDQLQAAREVPGFSLDAAAKAQIERILLSTISNPVGPEFMAPPQRP